MAQEVTNVTAGKPAVGGAIYRAPLGTALPTNATSALASAFVSLGYISEDGLKNNNTAESEDVKAWGGDVVMSTQTGKTDEFTATFIESLNIEVLKTIFGDDNVSGNLASGIVVRANSKELSASVYVVDQIMREGALKRIVIPNGKISEVGEVTYNDSDPVGYEATIKALPGEDGDTHKEYIKRASRSLPENTRSAVPMPDDPEGSLHEEDLVMDEYGKIPESELEKDEKGDETLTKESEENAELQVEDLEEELKTDGNER